MRASPSTILAPDWYARMLGPGFESLDAAIARARPAWLAAVERRVPALRGLLVFRLAASRPASAVLLGEPGAATLLFLEAWVRRRRSVVVLELIPRRPDRRLRRALHGAWSSLVLRPALRRAMLAGQVLSEAERDRYAEELRLDPDRLATIPWAWSTGARHDSPPAAERAGVLAAGRAWTDWETLFEAARGRGWPLTVIAGERYTEELARLNGDGTARVLSEIPRQEHEELARRAAVYVIALRADAPSAGQVRLMSATDAGAAVVATRVAALDGYVEDGGTALLVEPGDAEALASAVERLLGSPAERSRLAAAARRRASAWTYAEYFAAIGELIRGFSGERI